jgi:hypothetical protein
LPFGFAFPSPFALCPWLGGVEELEEVFGGSLSFARSAAFSARSSKTSDPNAVTRETNAATRASNVVIRASFSAAERDGISDT